MLIDIIDFNYSRLLDVQITQNDNQSSGLNNKQINNKTLAMNHDESLSSGFPRDGRCTQLWLDKLYDKEKVSFDAIDFHIFYFFIDAEHYALMWRPLCGVGFATSKQHRSTSQN